MLELWRWLKIVLMCVIAAVVYGVCHDQVTVRISLEYFTVGHPPIFPTSSPTLLALGWGVIATWWVGALLGIPLAISARAGRRPRRNAGALVRPILILFCTAAICAVIGGLIGYTLANMGIIYLVPHLADRISENRRTAFLVAGWMHSVSYLVGFIGGTIVVIQTWRHRRIDPPTAPID